MVFIGDSGSRLTRSRHPNEALQGVAQTPISARFCAGATGSLPSHEADAIPAATGQQEKIARPGEKRYANGALPIGSGLGATESLFHPARIRVDERL